MFSGLSDYLIYVKFDIVVPHIIYHRALEDFHISRMMPNIHTKNLRHDMEYIDNNTRFIMLFIVISIVFVLIITYLCSSIGGSREDNKEYAHDYSESDSNEQLYSLQAIGDYMVYTRHKTKYNRTRVESSDQPNKSV